MAVRVDLFAVTEPTSFAPSEQTEAGRIGFVAASDEDEGELIALLEASASEGVLVGAINHGSGVEVVTAAACAAVPTSSPLSRTWMDVISWAAETADVQQCRLGWLTRYDRGGSRDDGDDEWRTSWSDAPTEGTGPDSPWPSG